jgi:hypothetical protein
MSSGLHVDFAQAKVEEVQEDRVETSEFVKLSTPEPGVDSERSRGGNFGEGKGSQNPHPSASSPSVT